jgi:Zn-dependent protease with chaperone function
MDFFEAQDRARRRSGRLVLLFALALLGITATLYVAALFIGDATFLGTDHRWWRPELFGIVALFTVAVCGIAALSRWLQLRAGGPAVAERVGGIPVPPDTTDLRERTLLNVVEEMALASGLPVPAVYVLPGEPAINAFAAGYSPADAAVAVTAGALARLDRDELQGVIAHEFSHILNGDMRLNTRLSALVFGILSLSILGRGLLRSLRHLGGSGPSRRRGKDSGAGLALALIAAGLVLLLVGYVGHLFGKLIQAAVSRQREHLADAAAVQFTRNPSGLARALKKLGGSALEGRLDHARASELSHYCFAQNFRHDLGGLFATHPPLAARIRALDPSWDGAFAPSSLAPRTSATAPASAQAALASIAAAFAAPASVPAARISAGDLLDTAGQTSPAALAAARAFIAEVPEAFREIVHDPAHVPALCLALCLPHAASAPALAPLLAEIARRASPSEARRAAELHAALAPVPAAHHLALLQLAAPALRRLEPAAAATLLDSLQALAHADGALTPHEFALQKIVSRALGLASRPRDALQVISPANVAGELSLALSAASRIEAADASAATLAFARAAVEFNGLQPPLAYRPEAADDTDQLDLALEHLAHTPAPFRKRVLKAFATALTADARLTQTEADLLRAFAATLDCPLPPVLPVSA